MMVMDAEEIKTVEQMFNFIYDAVDQFKRLYSQEKADALEEKLDRNQFLEDGRNHLIGMMNTQRKIVSRFWNDLDINERRSLPGTEDLDDYLISLFENRH